MSVCIGCGNAILTQTILVGLDAKLCLVCQHTGRGEKHTATELQTVLRQVVAERQAGALAVALDAVYAAISPKPEQPLTPEEEFREAQQSLRHRIRFPGHNREKPDWEEIDREEREKNECQTCIGSGQVNGQKCPMCWSEY